MTNSDKKKEEREIERSKREREREDQRERRERARRRWTVKGEEWRGRRERIKMGEGTDR